MLLRKFILTIAAVLLAATMATARTFVLSAGVSNYGDDRNNLSQTTKDAKRFAQLMSTTTKDITILTSKNVTRDNFLSKLQAICNRAQKGDRIILFYSGHGTKGGMCGYDKTIPYSEVVKRLNASAASQKIAFIDACFAGTLADDGLTQDAASPGTAYFVSSRPNEMSAESPFLGAGLFTQALLKGLRGKSDANNDRSITVEELFRYMHNDIVKHSRNVQHPQLIAPKSMYSIPVMTYTK